MNIVQAYTKFKTQNIILFSGFSGSGKTKISRFIADLFGFQHINLSRFYYPKDVYDKDENYVLIKDDYRVLDWDNIYKSVDWNKLNNFVNDNKSKGIVLVGFGFPKTLLTFDHDFHIHIKINKKTLIENREAYMESHAADFYLGKEAGESEYQKAFDRDKTILNNITYQMYLKLIEDSKIDKFINTNDISEDKIKEEVFSYLMNMISKWLIDNSNRGKNVSTGKTQQISKTKNTSKKPNVHYDGNASYYDEFYYPDKKRVLYDFNDEGIDYPPEYIKKFGAQKNDSSSSSSSSSASSDDSDATFLFTTDGRELQETTSD